MGNETLAAYAPVDYYNPAAYEVKGRDEIVLSDSNNNKIIDKTDSQQTYDFSKDGSTKVYRQATQAETDEVLKHYGIKYQAIIGRSYSDVGSFIRTLSKAYDDTTNAADSIGAINQAGTKAEKAKIKIDIHVIYSRAIKQAFWAADDARGERFYDTDPNIHNTIRNNLLAKAEGLIQAALKSGAISEKEAREYRNPYYNKPVQPPVPF